MHIISQVFVIIYLFLLTLLCYNLRRPGGDRIYGVFDYQLPAALKKLPLDRYLSLQNIRKVISEADGYQPHLIAPEQGYRRLIDGALNYFRGPADASVDAVSAFFLFIKYGVPFYFFEGWGWVVLGEVIEISNHLCKTSSLLFSSHFWKIKNGGSR